MKIRSGCGMLIYSAGQGLTFKHGTYGKRLLRHMHATKPPCANMLSDQGFSEIETLYTLALNPCHAE